jgi:hypothetical protein
VFVPEKEVPRQTETYVQVGGQGVTNAHYMFIFSKGKPWICAGKDIYTLNSTIAAFVLFFVHRLCDVGVGQFCFLIRNDDVACRLWRADTLGLCAVEANARQDAIREERLHCELQVAQYLRHLRPARWRIEHALVRGAPPFRCFRSCHCERWKDLKYYFPRLRIALTAIVLDTSIYTSVLEWELM